MQYDLPTPNAMKLLNLDRALAAWTCGDLKLNEVQVKDLKAQRRNLLAHLEAAQRCPTCGHELTGRTLVSAVPSGTVG